MLASRIKQLRETRRLDISQLEALTSISAAHLYRIEKGERIPGADTLARLATALETSADYLLGISHDPNPRPIVNHPALLDPNLTYIVHNWQRLPQDSQRMTRELVETLLGLLDKKSRGEPIEY